MQAFDIVTGLVAPLDRANIDTDAIIPKQYLKSVQRSGFGPNLFDDWRYLDHGEPGMDHSTRRLNPDFILNLPRYQGAKILLARANFGCGSSREHAVWALTDAGFRCVIAPSFADIFFNNAFKNGLLPLVLPDDVVELLFAEVAEQTGYHLTVDLPQQTVITPSQKRLTFRIDAARKQRLVEGLDDIALTLAHADTIRAYEDRRRQEAPWLFAPLEPTAKTNP